MKIVQINMLSHGSTGKIMLQIAKRARERGHTTKTFATIPFDKKDKSIEITNEGHYIFGSFNENRIHYYLGLLLGQNGLHSSFGTLGLINQIKKFKPDIVHLHNLHKFCINLPMLFRYLKKSEVNVVWTLHDCWAFTGHCPHFTMEKCSKWKKGCYECPQINNYPKSLIDNSHRMYFMKKKWFAGVKNMTLVTPSEWLADLTKQSFLRGYPITVINNGIDLDVFKPTQSNFRKKFNIPETKKILLGVAFGWSKRKGLDVFLELENRLDKNKYQIVLVGTDDTVDRQLPNDIISIHRTQNQNELAEIYSVADVFINPTREEVFGLVNIESLACGTPVVTFQTGGSPETLNENCGSIVDCDDIDAMEKEIIRICEEEPYSLEDCLARAQQFDKNDRFEEYVKLYENCTHST